MTWTKEEKKTYFQEYRENNKERILDAEFRYREAHRAQLRERQRKFYWTHRDKILERQRNRKKQDPAVQKAYFDAYRANNREKLRQRQREYRARLKDGVVLVKGYTPKAKIKIVRAQLEREEKIIVRELDIKSGTLISQRTSTHKNPFHQTIIKPKVRHEMI